MKSADFRVAFRVDASRQIGTGHATRCLALADAIRRRRGLARFVSRLMPPHLREMILLHGHEFVQLNSADAHTPNEGHRHADWLGTTEAADAEAAVHALGEQAWDLLVVDHYSLGARWENALRRVTRRILVIDDLADREHDCELLLDQNACTEGTGGYDGRIPGHCRLLLGPSYALLREEFRRLHVLVNARSGITRRVLVFMGGSDPGNYTSLAIEALAKTGKSDLEVDVVIGELHAEKEHIERTCAARGYRCRVQTADIANIMAKADLAIGSGGTATWERCCLGLPTLTVCIADNQKRLIEYAVKCNLIYAVDIQPGGTQMLTDQLLALFDNSGLLHSMSANGLLKVDGRGVDRVLRAAGFSTVRMRDATHADSANILSWRNDPAVRLVSRRSGIIDEKTHESWYRSVLAHPDRILLVGERGGNPVGVVRFDIAGGEAVISIFLVPGQSGRGLGGELLAAAEKSLVERRGDVKVILAEVQGENQPSHSLFSGSGYERRSTSYLKRLDGR